MLSNGCVAIGCFLVKINPGAIHRDYYHRACTKSCACPGHQTALLEPTFSGLTWTGTEEEGSGKRFINNSILSAS